MIRSIILAVACMTMASCASYSIKIQTPDGLMITGRAIVMNESDDVALTVETPTYSASFGKIGTSAKTHADLAADVVDTITGPNIPLL